MWDSFLVDNNNFELHGGEHLITLLVSFIIGFALIWISNRYLSEKQQVTLITIIALIVWLSQMGKIVIRLNLGVFDIKEDLPLHLCNMMPFLVPFVMYSKNRKWWAVLFFWIMAGTFQALITPTLKDSFPHYEFWRYFIVHGGLVFCMLYGIFVFDFRLTWRDALRAGILLNVLAFFMYHISVFLDANYLYLRWKPDGDTIYNLLGPWPYYILSLEVLLVVLFSIILLPFYLFRKKEAI
jgi:hypothetical integral membrane protein (TIGR02206 family)